jgi:hypothetical protein
MSGDAFIQLLVAPTTTWGIVLRAIIWVLIATVIIASSNRYSPRVDPSQAIKRRLGSVLLFMFLSVGLVYLLFSYVPA